MTEIDYLDEDPIMQQQAWICVSFLSPEHVKGNFKVRGMKFRGAFPTREEAEAHAKFLQEKVDKNFHIFVGEGFKWIQFDPDPNSIDTQIYDNKELNNLMKAQKEQLLEQKMFEEERKEQLLKEGIDKQNEAKCTNKTKERLQQKLAARKLAEADAKAVIDDKIKEVKEAEEKVNESQKEVDELSTAAKRLQSAYNKLKNKQKK